MLFSQKENSKWRQHYLSSLYEYMQTSNKELQFLSEEQDKIRTQDWSDHMAHPPDIRRQYEVLHPPSSLLRVLNADPAHVRALTTYLI